MLRNTLWVAFLICGCATVFGQAAKSGNANPSLASKESINTIQSLIRSGAYDQALARSHSALQDTPKDFRLWALEGIVLSIQNKDDDALRAFGRALDLSPDYSAALKGEVQLYYKSQDKRAIPLLVRILKSDPKDETAHEMLAMVENRQGDCAAAEDHFALSTDAIARHPASLEAYGSCLIQTGQPEKAVDAFQQLAVLLPQRAYAKYDLAVALAESKQYDEAKKVLEPLLAVEPVDPDVLSLASDVYEASGDTPKAVSFLRQAIVLNPTNAPYYTSFAAICMDHESFQVGIDMLNAGLKRISNDPSLYLSRGLLYAQIAKYDQAEADFKTAERMDSGQSVSAYALDLAELQQNNSASTVSQIRSQLQLHPDSALLHYLLARQLSSQDTDAAPDSEKKSSDEALMSALEAVKLKPDMTEARDLLASIYADAAQYPQAIEQCRLALKTNPNDQTAIYHLIVALRHSGDDSQRAEIPVLVKRLAELQKTARQRETDRKRFKLVEQPAPSSQ
jgi:tetratricopeptide (TPR) repeat protein